MAQDRKNFRGILALLLVGGVYLYRNRTTIMRFLDQVGIKVPEQLPERVQDVVKKAQDRLAG